MQGKPWETTDFYPRRVLAFAELMDDSGKYVYITRHIFGNSVSGYRVFVGRPNEMTFFANLGGSVLNKESAQRTYILKAISSAPQEIWIQFPQIYEIDAELEDEARFIEGYETSEWVPLNVTPTIFLPQSQREICLVEESLGILAYSIIQDDQPSPELLSAQYLVSEEEAPDGLARLSTLLSGMSHLPDNLVIQMQVQSLISVLLQTDQSIATSVLNKLEEVVDANISNRGCVNVILIAEHAAAIALEQQAYPWSLDVSNRVQSLWLMVLGVSGQPTEVLTATFRGLAKTVASDAITDEILRVLYAVASMRYGDNEILDRAIGSFYSEIFGRGIKSEIPSQLRFDTSDFEFRD